MAPQKPRQPLTRRVRPGSAANTEDMAPKTRANSMDEDSKAIIYDGANLSQLCKIFRMDRRNMSEKLHNVPPKGERHGFPIWEIADVAPHIVKPIYEIEEYIKRMHHNDLPKHLTKEYWAGLRSRQEYLLKEGDLWPTDKVLAKFSEVLKRLRMSILLTRDAVERDTILSTVQRDRMTQLIDGALNDAADSLLAEFADDEDDNDGGL